MFGQPTPIVAAILLGVVITTAVADDAGSEPAAPDGVEAKNPEDLALALIKAACEGDVKIVQKQMPTDEVFAKIAPPNGQEQFRLYRDSFVPKVVEGLHKELVSMNATDAKLWKVKLAHPDKEMRGPPGLALRTTTGVIVSNGELEIEIVDHGLGIDGRWYVVNFCTEEESTKFAGQSFPEFLKMQNP